MHSTIAMIRGGDDQVQQVLGRVWGDATGVGGGRYCGVMLEDLLGRVRLLTLACSDYPAGLRDLSDAPAAFRVVGELPELRRAIAIVGTRRADDEALDFAYSLAREAVMNGVTVVSGGAIGVDRAAHEGAIDGGGRTVVVLPTGLDAPYPRANHDLFARAVEAGCLLTEAEDGADAQRGRFLTRNRLIAALGRSTVVVQAPARSGALSTARFAMRLGRPVGFRGARFTLGSTWIGQSEVAVRGVEDLRGSRRCPIGDRADGRRPCGRFPKSNRKHSRFQ